MGPAMAYADEDRVYNVRRPSRVRALTERGASLFEQQVETYAARLLWKQHELVSAIEESASPTSLALKRAHVSEKLFNYEQTSAEFINCFNRYNTQVSEWERVSHMVTLRSLQEKAHALLRGTDVILRNRTRRLDTIPSSSSCHSRVSNPSNLALKSRSRLDAVKTELEFASCEAELRKAQAELTVRQSYIQMLATQQDATAAELENIRHNNVDTNHDYDCNSVSSHGLSDTEYRGDDICDIAESLVVSPPTGHPANLSRLVDNSIHFGQRDTSAAATGRIVNSGKQWPLTHW